MASYYLLLYIDGAHERLATKVSTKNHLLVQSIQLRAVKSPWVGTFPKKEELALG